MSARIGRLRAFLVPAARERGTTLIELIVAISLTALVASLVVGSLVNVSHTLTTNTISGNSSGVASTAMQEVSRVVRSGTEIPVLGGTSLQAFAGAGANAVTLYAFVDTTAASPKPVKVQFSVTGAGELVETRWAATSINVTYWAFDATPLSQRVVARGVVTASRPAVFTYVDSNGVALVLPSGGTLTAAQVDSIAAVKIQLTVQSGPSGGVAQVSLTNTVGIPNLDTTRIDGAGL